MNPRITEARARLAGARTEYVRKLRAIEGLLRAAVAQDPANIADAEAVRSEYTQLLVSLDPLAGAEQPIAQHNAPQPRAIETSPAETSIGGDAPEVS